jgi:hypothetical protein
LFERRRSGHDTYMTDHETEEHSDEGAANELPSDHPAENTEPPSNPEVDSDRVEQAQEDAEKTVPS